MSRPYTGRRWSFNDYTGTVCSEPFSLTLPLANGDGNLTGEMTHGCVAVNLDKDYRFFHKDALTGCQMYLGTIIGHVDDCD